jgi:hypothetical protein
VLSPCLITSSLNIVCNCDDDAVLMQLLEDMLQKLGDKYTRYLPPAKYQTIVQVDLHIFSISVALLISLPCVTALLLLRQDIFACNVNIEPINDRFFY